MPHHHVSARRLLVGPALALAAFAGCSNEEPVRIYQVLKPEFVERGSVKALPTATSTATKPVRMLGAILPGKDLVWFFKVTDEPDAVARLLPDFKAFLNQVRLNAAGEPEWDLPAGWTAQPGSALRFATLTAPAEGRAPLQVAVSNLPRGDVEMDDFLLANVNRWRGQLGLAPAGTDWKAALESVPTRGEAAWLVDLSGQSSGAGMGPMAGAAAPSLPGASTTSAPPMSAGGDIPSEKSELKYDVPAGWQPAPLNALRKAAFLASGEQGKVEITVFEFPGAVGGLTENINRWRGQIGLDPASADDIARSARAVTVRAADGGELPSQRFELVGPTDAPKPQKILAVVIPARDSTWFVKLQGDAAVADAEAARFDEFVASLKLGTAAR